MNQKQVMQQYMKEHLPLYIFVSVLFVMGIVFGALMVNSLSLEQKQEMSRYLGSFFHTIEQGTDIGGQGALLSAFWLHVKWVALIWVLGLSVVGLPILLILNFFKGVLVGFTVGFLAGQLSYRGMLFALVSVAPQNMVAVPVILIVSVTATAFSLFLIKYRFTQGKGSVYRELVKYTSLTLFMTAVLFLISLFEAYVSPELMRWVTPMLTGAGN